MQVDRSRSTRFTMALAIVAVWPLTWSVARGQYTSADGLPPRIAQTPQSPYQPGGGYIGGPGTSTGPMPETPVPSTPSDTTSQPSQPSQPSQTPTPSPENAPSQSNMPSFDAGQSAALGGQTFAVADNAGYIDSAVIRTRFRQRYDSAYDLNNPDRAEFFYPKCGCFGNIANFANFLSITNVGGQNVLNGVNVARQNGFDPRALGPQHPHNRPNAAGGGETRVDYQEISSYLEIAANRTTSGFIEMPVRFLNPTLNRNTYGFSDLNMGFKHAFVAETDKFYTFQFRAYMPTGSGEKGLGTNHVSLEPGFLVFQQLSERLFFMGELRDWIPVHATNFGGNVLRYGAGFAYNVVLTDNLRIAPVNEFVGWTVLSGKESAVVADPNTGLPTGVAANAAGVSIVNYKIGLRLGIGDYRNAQGGSVLNDRHSFYFGYGRAITGEHWYRDMLRVEYNFWF